MRGQPTAYLLILQHHLVSASTRIVAPRVLVAGEDYRALLLEMTSVPRRLIRHELRDAQLDDDAVSTALDTIFRRTPVGLPLS